MGLGKTLCALIYTAENDLRTLVICPNSLKYVWADEIEKWTDKSHHVVKATDRKVKFGYDYTIINYDIVHKFFSCERRGGRQYWKLKPQFFSAFKELDCVIVDESHYIKSTKARRSKVVKKIDVPRKILLTGTPLTNKPMDLWNQLNYLDKNSWNNWLDYRERYIEGYNHPRMGFFIETGTRNIEELASRINPYIFRRRKEDVLKELPEKIYNKIGSEMEGKHLEMYATALQDFYEFLKEFTDLTNKEIWRRLRAQAFTKVMMLKQICADYKLDTMIKSFVENVLENNPDDKIVLFSQYRKVAIELAKMFPSNVLIYGDIDPEERAKRIKKFQNDPSIKLFIGTIQTSGVGITLTKASNVIFCDLPWTPAEIEQAVDRTHRFGQDKPVNIYYLVLKNSIENKIYRLLERKRSIIDQILDGEKVRRKTNIKDEFLKSEIKEAQKTLGF
jgi:SWI/SNF-related matrix-associated actin-dependent regulator 1 of chromatin subfamily A